MLLKILSSRAAWAVFAVAAIVVLGVVSYHPPPSTAAARISQLDSVIKCPGCEDLSIAQSNAPSSVALRTEVASWVAQGESNAAIEQAVVDRYGTSGLLVPNTTSGAVLYIVPVCLIAVAAASLGLFLWRRQRLLAQVPAGTS